MLLFKEEVIKRLVLKKIAHLFAWSKIALASRNFPDDFSNLIRVLFLSP
jgi:hypothetical protein